jgi:hypothetical protein
LREVDGKIVAFPALQSNQKKGGAPFLPLPLLQEALGNDQELAWYNFYQNTRVDIEPIHHSLVVHDVLQSFTEP